MDTNNQTQVKEDGISYRWPRGAENIDSLIRRIIDTGGQVGDLNYRDESTDRYQQVHLIATPTFNFRKIWWLTRQLDKALFNHPTTPGIIGQTEVWVDGKVPDLGHPVMSLMIYVQNLEIEIEHTANAIKKSRALIGSRDLGRVRRSLEAVLRNK